MYTLVVRNSLGRQLRLKYILAWTEPTTKSNILSPSSKPNHERDPLQLVSSSRSVPVSSIGIPATARPEVTQSIRRFNQVEIKEYDPFDDLNKSIAEISKIIQVFTDELQNNRKGSQLRKIFVSSLSLVLIMYAEVKREPYLYHTIKEYLKIRSADCSPRENGNNSGIVYR